MHHDGMTTSPARSDSGTAPKGGAEVIWTGQSMSSREQEGSERPGRMLSGPSQADKLERPLRRRDDRIERPARVRIRNRKP